MPLPSSPAQNSKISSRLAAVLGGIIALSGCQIQPETIVVPTEEVKTKTGSVAENEPKEVVKIVHATSTTICEKKEVDEEIEPEELKTFDEQFLKLLIQLAINPSPENSFNFEDVGWSEDTITRDEALKRAIKYCGDIYPWVTQNEELSKMTLNNILAKPNPIKATIYEGGKKKFSGYALYLRCDLGQRKKVENKKVCEESEFINDRPYDTCREETYEYKYVNVAGLFTTWPFVIILIKEGENRSLRTCSRSPIRVNWG